MTVWLSPENLLAWALQVLAVALAAAALPLVLHIRHPRTQLVYCPLALIACLLLPVMQRWRHPVIVTGESLSEQQPSRLPGEGQAGRAARLPIAWNQVALWLLVAGAAGRLM